MRLPWLFGERQQLPLPTRGPRFDPAKAARRWAELAAKDPRLAEDVTALGGIYSRPLLTNDDAQNLAMTAEEMAYREGRRGMALDLLALMQTTMWKLSKISEGQDVDGMD